MKRTYNELNIHLCYDLDKDRKIIQFITAGNHLNITSKDERASISMNREIMHSEKYPWTMMMITIK